MEFYDLEGGAAAQFDYWRAHDGWLPFFPKDLPGNPATAIYREAAHDITTEIMGEYVADFLDTVPRDRPFSLSVSFTAPHNSLVSSMHPEGADPACDEYACRVMGYPANGNPRLDGHPVYDTLYRNQRMPVAADTGRNPFRFIPEGIIDHQARQKWYAYNYDADLEKEHLVRYYQTITGVDRVVGKLVAQLERLGLSENTVIIFSSDHGLLNGEYGTGGKALLYDLVVKVPLVIHDPRTQARERANTRRDLVLNIDIPATILAYAGIAAPETMQGRDLTTDSAPRDAVFLENLTVAEGNPFMEAVRTRDWKYIRFFERRGCPYGEDELDFSGQQPVFEQLFNLRNDPRERVNLAVDRAHTATLEAMRQRTRERSEQLTQSSREYKRDLAVPLRPTDREYCW